MVATTLYIHADWETLARPLLLGVLHARPSGRQELAPAFRLA